MTRQLSISSDDYRKAVALTLTSGLTLSEAIVQVVAPPPDPGKREKPEAFVERYWKGANAQRDVGIMAKRERARGKRRKPDPPPVRPVEGSAVFFTIPAKVPSFNELDKHVGKKIRIKKTWRIAVRVAVDEAGIGCFDGPIALRFVYFEPNRRRDEDNIDSGGRKVIIDGLKHAGVIRNDGQRHVHGMSFSVEKGPYSVIVAIRRIKPRTPVPALPKPRHERAKHGNEEGRQVRVDNGEEAVV